MYYYPKDNMDYKIYANIMEDGQIVPSIGVTIDGATIVELNESDITQTGKIKKTTILRIKSELMQDLVS